MSPSRAQAPVRPATAPPHTLRCPQSPVRPRPVPPCWSGTGHRHVPGCLHGCSCRTGHRSDNRLPPSLSRVTPSAASEHVSELLGCPISRPLAACCVCLELRPLPSTGIIRLPRYCEPLRHPSAPGLSLAGVRLIIPDHALGLPVLRALSLCTCCRHYPGAAAGRSPRSKSPIRISLPRFHFRVGLHIVLFEACSAFTRVAACTLARSPYVVTAIRRLQTLRLLHVCYGRFRLERSPGGACTHWKSAALSRRTWKAAIRTGFLHELCDCAASAGP